MLTIDMADSLKALGQTLAVGHTLPAPDACARHERLQCLKNFQPPAERGLVPVILAGASRFLVEGVAETMAA
jgi:hypothetical protein